MIDQCRNLTRVVLKYSCSNLIFLLIASEVINLDDEDKNAFNGLWMKPSKFIPESETYQLKMDIAGNRDELTDVQVILTNVLDSSFVFNFKL